MDNFKPERFYFDLLSDSYYFSSYGWVLGIVLSSDLFFQMVTGFYPYGSRLPRFLSESNTASFLHLGNLNEVT